MVFETSMGSFDVRSPGYYLRLIHRVRLMVVALIAPTQGIRATLSNSGISQVVVPRDGGFGSVALQRGFEQVLFTSTMNSSGQFELDVQPELLSPFQGSGVATRWVLELPRAANAFDYSSLADVVVTIEYTALYDAHLREKTTKELSNEAAGERVFSIRNEFPDAWYDLHNSVDPTVLKAELTMTRGDFPPNLDRVRMRQITLQLLGTGVNAPGAVDVALLGFAAEGTTAFLGGSAKTDEMGVASTRRANGTAWLPILNAQSAANNVSGKWRLELTGPARALLEAGKIDDILLAVSFVGEQPAWQ